MKPLLAILILFFAAALVRADLTLPEQVPTAPGVLVVVKAQTKGTHVVWFTLDTELQLLSPDLLKDSSTMVLVARKTGTYKLIAWTAIDGKPSKAAVCLIVVGDGPPVPPPDVEAFTKALKGAWAQEVGTKKVEQVGLLTELYRQATDFAASDQTIKTLGHLLERMQKARKLLLPDDALPRVRGVIADELDKTFAKDRPYDAATRVQVVEAFRRVSKALEGLR